MKIRSNFLVIPFLLLLPVCVQVSGQVSETAPASVKPKAEATVKPTPPVMVEKATTETGKFVLLKSDGTWEYDTTPRPTQNGTPVTVGSKGSLRFKAAVITRSGNVIPAARGDFYLLDEDLRVISAKKADEEKSKGNTTPYMMSQDGKLIEPHKIAKASTDFEGNGTFADIPPKTYWVYYFGSVGVNWVLWSFKVEVKAGDNYVLLDQNNALETFTK